MRALALIYIGGNPLLGVPSTFRRLFASEIGIFPVPVVVVAVLVTFYQLLATGIIIILAMLVDRSTRGRE